MKTLEEFEDYFSQIKWYNNIHDTTSSIYKNLLSELITCCETLLNKKIYHKYILYLQAFEKHLKENFNLFDIVNLRPDDNTQTLTITKKIIETLSRILDEKTYPNKIAAQTILSKICSNFIIHYCEILAENKSLKKLILKIKKSLPNNTIISDAYKKVIKTCKEKQTNDADIFQICKILSNFIDDEDARNESYLCALHTFLTFYPCLITECDFAIKIYDELNKSMGTKELDKLLQPYKNELPGKLWLCFRLKKFKADATIKYINNHYQLHKFCESKSKKIVTNIKFGMILYERFGWDKKNQKGDTPIDYLCKNNNPKSLDALCYYLKKYLSEFEHKIKNYSPLIKQYNEKLLNHYLADNKNKEKCEKYANKLLKNPRKLIQLIKDNKIPSYMYQTVSSKEYQGIPCGYSILAIAIILGKKKLITNIIEKHSDNINMPLFCKNHSYSARTAFELAVELTKYNIVKDFLNYTKISISSLCSMLQYSIEKNDFKMLKIFTTELDKHDYTYEHEVTNAIEKKNINPQIIKHLLTKKINFNKIKYILYDAITHSLDIKSFEKLIQNGAKITNEVITTIQNEKQNSLYQPILNKYLKKFKTNPKPQNIFQIIRNADFRKVDDYIKNTQNHKDFKNKHHYGETILTYSIIHGQAKMTKKLIDSKLFGLEQPNIYNQTPLNVSIIAKDHEIFKYLLKNGSKLYMTNCLNKMHVINYALGAGILASKNCSNIIRYILDENLANKDNINYNYIKKLYNINKTNSSKQKCTPLINSIHFKLSENIAEVISLHPDTICEKLKKTYKINKFSITCDTPLHYALLYSQTNTAINLLGNGSTLPTSDFLQTLREIQPKNKSIQFIIASIGHLAYGKSHYLFKTHDMKIDVKLTSSKEICLQIDNKRTIDKVTYRLPLKLFSTTSMKNNLLDIAFKVDNYKLLKTLLIHHKHLTTHSHIKKIINRAFQYRASKLVIKVLHDKNLFTHNHPYKIYHYIALKDFKKAKETLQSLSKRTIQNIYIENLCAHLKKLDNNTKEILFELKSIQTDAIKNDVKTLIKELNLIQEIKINKKSKKSKRKKKKKQFSLKKRLLKKQLLEKIKRAKLEESAKTFNNKPKIIRPPEIKILSRGESINKSKQILKKYGFNEHSLTKICFYLYKNKEVKKIFQKELPHESKFDIFGYKNSECLVRGLLLFPTHLENFVNKLKKILANNSKLQQMIFKPNNKKFKKKKEKKIIDSKKRKSKNKDKKNKEWPINATGLYLATMDGNVSFVKKLFDEHKLKYTINMLGLKAYQYAFHPNATQKMINLHLDHIIDLFKANKFQDQIISYDLMQIIDFCIERPKLNNKLKLLLENVKKHEKSKLLEDFFNFEQPNNMQVNIFEKALLMNNFAAAKIIYNCLGKICLIQYDYGNVFTHLINKPWNNEVEDIIKFACKNIPLNELFDTDLKGYSIFHKVIYRGNLALFECLLKNVPKDQLFHYINQGISEIKIPTENKKEDDAKKFNLAMTPLMMLLTGNDENIPPTLKNNFLELMLPYIDFWSNYNTGMIVFKKIAFEPKSEIAIMLKDELINNRLTKMQDNNDIISLIWMIFVLQKQKNIVTALDDLFKKVEKKFIIEALNSVSPNSSDSLLESMIKNSRWDLVTLCIKYADPKWKNSSDNNILHVLAKVSSKYYLELAKKFSGLNTQQNKDGLTPQNIYINIKKAQKNSKGLKFFSKDNKNNNDPKKTNNGQKRNMYQH
ncbi:MAG: ankyrin repeat domain-containing protein [Gammaproteobacteria bacterium]|jgi:hypothetical protein